MIVERVELENIKSYGDRTSVELGEGIVSVIGDNGVGKSTIQEAIGFALFDSLPYSQSDFAREGENYGSVWVTFRSDDGSLYTVCRYAGRSDYYVRDEETGAKLGLDGVSEVKSWLKEEFGLDQDDELSEIWEKSIGVPQTQFLSDFTQSEKVREDTFDPLLNVEKYREGFKSLSDLSNVFEKEIEEREEETAELRGELKQLPDKRSEVEELRSEIEEKRGELEEVKQELEEVKQEYESLGEVHQNIEDTEDAIEDLEGEVESERSRLEDAKELLEEAEEAKDALEEVKEDYQRHETAQEELDELQELEEERDGILDEKMR